MTEPSEPPVEPVEPRQISVADLEKVIVPVTKDLIAVTHALQNNPEFIALLKQYVKITPTWKQHWAGITHHIGVLINICMLVTVLPEGLIPPADAAWIALGIQVLSLLAASLVPTAISTSQAKSLEADEGKHRKVP